MEKKNKRHVKPKTEKQKQIDKLVDEIDQTDVFTAFLTRAKNLFGRPLVEGIFYGIGGAITTLFIKKYIIKDAALPK